MMSLEYPSYRYLFIDITPYEFWQKIPLEIPDGKECDKFWESWNYKKKFKISSYVIKGKYILHSIFLPQPPQKSKRNCATLIISKCDACNGSRYYSIWEWI